MTGSQTIAKLRAGWGQFKRYGWKEKPKPREATSRQRANNCPRVVPDLEGVGGSHTALPRERCGIEHAKLTEQVPKADHSTIDHGKHRIVAMCSHRGNTSKRSGTASTPNMIEGADGGSAHHLPEPTCSHQNDGCASKICSGSRGEGSKPRDNRRSASTAIGPTATGQ